MFISNLFKLFLIVSFFTIILPSNPAYAIEIIPHFTAGPGDVSGPIEIPGAASERFEGPQCGHPSNTPADNARLCVAGSQTGTDCSALTAQEKLTTFTGAACVSLERLSAFIKNDIVLNIEFYAVINTGNVLGFSAPDFVAIPTNDESGKGYNEVRQALINSEQAEAQSFPIVSFLPTHAQFTANLPDGFLLGQDWKPRTLRLSTGQAKAMGILDKTIDVPDVFADIVTLPNMDAVSMTLNDIPDPENNIYDLDPSDGVGISPLKLKDWDAVNIFREEPIIPFVEPGPISEDSTFPEGYLPKKVFDFQGLIAHNIMPAFGVESLLNDILFADGLAIVKQQGNVRGVRIVDLYHIAEDELGNITSLSDFTTIPRNFTIVDSRPPDLNLFANLILEFPVDPRTGNHTVVYDVVNGAAQAIPMSGGGSPFDLFAGKGDLGDFSSTRTPFILEFDLTLNQINRLDWYTLRDAGANKNVIPPSPALMNPILLVHTVNEATREDLIILDLIGYDIDFDVLGKKIKKNKKSMH